MLEVNPGQSAGKVWFIGAGPGDPELLTVKGQRLIAQADLILYAGSLVPPAVLAGAAPHARLVNSAHLTLEETHALMHEAAAQGQTVARVHTGDPSLYGALREQIELLDRDGIAYEIIPGVSAAFAVAAAAAVSFTIPEVTQALAVTRLAGATKVPEGQGVRQLAASGASMAVYLSGADASTLADELGAAQVHPDAVIIAAYRVGWPEEKILRTTLARFRQDLAKMLEDINMPPDKARQLLFLVLPGENKYGPASRLYAPSFSHGFRNGSY